MNRNTATNSATAISGRCRSKKSVIRRHSFLRMASLLYATDKPTVFHVQAAIRDVVVAIVVRYREDGDAARFELRQQLGVELAAENRILVRRPFVEHAYRPPLEQCDDQGEALALAGGERDRGERTGFDACLVLDFEVAQK